MIKGKRLKEGDTIGVVAPASPVAREKVEQAEQGLKALGFQVKLGASCFRSFGYLAGRDEERAKDLNAMFADAEIHGIICLRGGYGATRMLDFIDYNLVKKQPKVFVGYSDITAIHGVFNRQCGLITFHGPMAVSNMADEFDEFSRESLLTMLEGSINTPACIRNPADQPLQTLVAGQAAGRLVGGNLSLLCAVLGTPYEIKTSGNIVFIEEVEEKPYRIDRMLTQLISAGKFKNVKGIILGDFNSCDAEDLQTSLSLMDVLADRLTLLRIPVIYGLKSGHCKPMVTLPFGAKVRMDGGACEITLLESPVI